MVKLFYMTGIMLSVLMQSVYAQDTIRIFGRVLDSLDRTKPIFHVKVYNEQTGMFLFSDRDGLFNVQALAGERLILSHKDFYADTIQVYKTGNLDHYMRPQGIQLQEVNIYQQNQAAERYAQKKEDYRMIYLLGDNKSIVEFSPFGGLALNLNKIYNHWSTEGKQSRRMQAIIEREYLADQLEELWGPLAAKYSGLTGEELLNFKRFYAPELDWIKTASVYELLFYIQDCTRRYASEKEEVNRKLLILPKD